MLPKATENQLKSPNTLCIKCHLAISLHNWQVGYWYHKLCAMNRDSLTMSDMAHLAQLMGIWFLWLSVSVTMKQGHFFLLLLPNLLQSKQQLQHQGKWESMSPEYVTRVYHQSMSPENVPNMTQKCWGNEGKMPLLLDILNTERNMSKGRIEMKEERKEQVVWLYDHYGYNIMDIAWPKINANCINISLLIWCGGMCGNSWPL